MPFTDVLQLPEREMVSHGLALLTGMELRALSQRTTPAAETTL